MAAPLEASFALIALGAVYALVLCARRIQRSHAHRRGSAARGRLEPVAYALLEGDPVERAGRRDERVLTEMLAELAPALTGETREAIADHFESSGAIARASRRLADPRAHRRAEHAALL